MNLRERWRRWRKRPRRSEVSPQAGPSKEALREFVYLDEVSLRSMLSSLRGDLREGRSEQSADEIQMEAATKLAASNPLAGSAELSSRFQTTNSSTIQTSRKATIQSWFRDFRAIPDIRLMEVAGAKEPAADIDALLSTTDRSLLISPDDLKRGELVEFRVILSADPVYQLSTMVTEFTGMAGDFPDMFAANNSLASIREIQPVNKILERLLAGLIPIRAIAVDYSVVAIDGAKYVIHNDLLLGLELQGEPLQVVGLTEHLAYWKDLRRVLFSKAEFTLLGRISRTGVHESWTPVKLADLFRDVAPGLVDQISAAGRFPLAPPSSRAAVDMNGVKLAEALAFYASAVLEYGNAVLDEDESAQLAERIEILSIRSGSASAQRSAFAEIRAHLKEVAGVETKPKRDLALRDKARDACGLSLFPSLTSSVVAEPAAPQRIVETKEEHLVDLEIVAIYW